MRLLSAQLLSAILAIVALGGPADARAQDAELRFETVARVIAFGDVHGAFDELVTLLGQLDVIDDDGRWNAGDAHLVSLGDLLDRGDDSRRVMDLLMRLQAEADAAGGRVHVVAGNHELMNLTGDLRYLTPGEYAAFAEDEDPAERAAARAAWIEDHASEFETLEAAGGAFDVAHPPGWFGHRAAFAPDGRYGAWLASLPVMIVINDVAYVHGGLTPQVARYGLEELNARYGDGFAMLMDSVRRLAEAGLVDPRGDLLRQARVLRTDLDAIEAALASPEDIEQPPPPPIPEPWIEEVRRFVALTYADVFGLEGPNWYRGSARCHEMVEQPVFEAGLAAIGASRAMIGHTPTSSRLVETRFDGDLIMADTGMNVAYYKGRPMAVLLEDGETRTWDARERNWSGLIPKPLTPLPGVGPAELADRVASALAASGPQALPDSEGYAAVAVDGATVTLRFLPMGARERERALAAFRLDLMLGLDLVAPTVAGSWQGEDGVFVVMPQRFASEQLRAERNVPRPNECGLSNVYQLLYAFDALIGNDGRRPDNMLYDMDGWRLLSIGHDDAFGTSRRLPRYLDSVTPEMPAPFAAAIAGLDEATLEAELGELLGSRQIRALLARRDTLLEDWSRSALQ